MILALMQLPPPVHGAAMRNKEFLGFLQAQGEVRYLDLAPKQGIGSIGKLRFGKVFSAANVLLRVISLLLRDRKTIDLVYITPSQGGWGLIRDALLILVVRIFGVDVVSHFRAVGIRRLKKIPSMLLRAALGNTRAVAMSPLVATDLLGVMDQSQIRIASNGLLEYSRNYKAIRDDSQFRILHVSNLSAAKGAFDVLDAFCRIRAECPVARLTIIGSWSEPSEEQRFSDLLQKSGVEGAVRMLGSLYAEAKWSEFQNSDAFLFPSTYPKECFPGVVMEAMSAGLPVVAYAHAAVPDIIEHRSTGWIAECGSVEGLVEGLRFLAGDRVAYDAISRRAYAEFHEKYRASITHPALLAALRK